VVIDTGNVGIIGTSTKDLAYERCGVTKMYNRTVSLSSYHRTFKQTLSSRTLWDTEAQSWFLQREYDDSGVDDSPTHSRNQTEDH
jgi:hypothetical protein